WDRLRISVAARAVAQCDRLAVDLEVGVDHLRPIEARRRGAIVLGDGPTPPSPPQAVLRSEPRARRDQTIRAPSGARTDRSRRRARGSRRDCAFRRARSPAGGRRVAPHARAPLRPVRRRRREAECVRRAVTARSPSPRYARARAAAFWG